MLSYHGGANSKIYKTLKGNGISRHLFQNIQMG